MRAQRPLAWFLVAVVGWNLLTWTMFARNLAEAHAAGEDRPQGYWIAHTVLIIVNLVITAVLAGVSWRSLRGRD